MALSRSVRLDSVHGVCADLAYLRCPRHSVSGTDVVIEVDGWGSNEYKQIDAEIKRAQMCCHMLFQLKSAEESAGDTIFSSHECHHDTHVFAGGAMSAFLDEGTSLLCVWGQHNVRIDGVHAACLNGLYTLIRLLTLLWRRQPWAVLQHTSTSVSASLK